MEPRLVTSHRDDWSNDYRISFDRRANCFQRRVEMLRWHREDNNVRPDDGMGVFGAGNTRGNSAYIQPLLVFFRGFLRPSAVPRLDDEFMISLYRSTE